MVNNEFHLIGIAVSNYVSVGNDKFKVHSFRIEVEKFGAKYIKTLNNKEKLYYIDL